MHNDDDAAAVTMGTNDNQTIIKFFVKEKLENTAIYLLTDDA